LFELQHLSTGIQQHFAGTMNLQNVASSTWHNIAEEENLTNNRTSCLAKSVITSMLFFSKVKKLIRLQEQYISVNKNCYTLVPLFPKITFFIFSNISTHKTANGIEPELHLCPKTKMDGLPTFWII